MTHSNFTKVDSEFIVKKMAIREPLEKAKIVYSTP